MLNLQKNTAINKAKSKLCIPSISCKNTHQGTYTQTMPSLYEPMKTSKRANNQQKHV